MYDNQKSNKLAQQRKLKNNSLNSDSKSEQNCSSFPKIGQRRKQSEYKHDKQSYLQHYAWVHKQVNYQSLTSPQIQQQNKKLKRAISKMDIQIDEIIKQLQPKWEKNANAMIKAARVKTDSSVQVKFQSRVEHRMQIQQKQYQNNKFTLQMCKNQFLKLKKRQKYIINEVDPPGSAYQNQKLSLEHSLLAQGKLRARLDSYINQMHSSINKTKTQNKKINDKNRTIGWSIQNTDSFIQKMKKLQLQLIMQQKTKKSILKKVQQNQASLLEMNKKIAKIKEKSDIADQYLRNQKLKCKQDENLLSKTENLKRKERLKQIHDKNKQIQQKNSQILYHNLLKQLESLCQSCNRIQQATQKVQILSNKTKKQIKTLQNIWKRKLQGNNVKMSLIKISNKYENNSYESANQQQQNALLQQNKVLNEAISDKQNAITKSSNHIQAQTQLEQVDLKNCNNEQDLYQNKDKQQKKLKL